MSNIFPIDFEEKLTMAQDDYILFSDSEDGNKIKKAQYKNLKGEPGTPGKDGEDGAAATITVGTTTTGAAGSSASVTNSGTSSAAVFNFTIPQGAKGEPGADGKDGTDGKDGADGTSATITVGTTTTLPAGSSATVTNSGTSSAAVLNFGIPKGDTGTGDVTGPASSTDGHIAVFDGATGKIIKDGGAIPTGDVGISSDTGNLLTAGADLWFGTESDFSSISTPDTNTLYIQYKVSQNNYTITGSTTVGSFTPGSFSDLQGFYMSPDGENAYITFWNNGNGRMAQYSLSTPWDISTASQTQYISVTKPNGFYFSNNGTYIFLSTEDGNNIIRYSLSTPWDISTASLDSGQVLNVSSSRFADNVCLSDDGDYIWFGVDSLYKIVQYELTTPFDLTTATNKKELSIAEAGIGVMVKNNGKYMYKTLNGPVKQYELATPYDITSTATEIGSYSVAVGEQRCLFVSNDCKYWTIGNNSGGITQFEAQPI